MSIQRMAAAMILALCGTQAWTAEFTYDFVVCSHGTQKLLDSGPELTAVGVEDWGITASSSTKEWENATTRCMGHVLIAGEKTTGKGICRWVQASGGTAVGEWEMAADGQNSWRWLAGTGKLAGIRGGGTFQWVTNGKAVEAGTGQSCRRDWGKYTLP